MTITAQSLVQRIQTTLQDLAGVRWPATELVDHINVFQRELVRVRPDAKAKTTAVTLVAGFRQTVPTEAYSLMDIPSNATGSRKRITKVDVVTLDAVEPAWRSRAESGEVKHFMHDLREPLVFCVYPPAVAGTQVDAVYSVAPTDIATPGGAAYTTVTGNLDAQDQWADAAVNFGLFKAYSKDAEYGGNAQLAANYMGLVTAAVGSQLQSATAVAPKS
jgi:hypothetical protein